MPRNAFQVNSLVLGRVQSTALITRIATAPRKAWNDLPLRLIDTV